MLGLLPLQPGMAGQNHPPTLYSRMGRSGGYNFRRPWHGAIIEPRRGGGHSFRRPPTKGGSDFPAARGGGDTEF